jgi:hypothetical protein
VIDAAVACETYLRMLVSRELPEELNPIFKDYIDKAEITKVLGQFFRKILSEDESKRLAKKTFSRLHDLFEDRNRIMHSGCCERLTEQRCKQYLDATRNLLALK